MFFAYFTGFLCGAGCLILTWMWGLNQLMKVNPMSLFYIGWNLAGGVMLVTSMLIDMSTNVLGGWVVQIVGFIASTWLTALFFRRKK